MTGRHSQPEDPYGRQSPAPRGPEDLPVAGRKPDPAPRPSPEPRRPEPPFSDGPPDWHSEENTYMINKLGYVPKESRGEFNPDSFDSDSVTAADRSKFRTRKRAKKSSPVSKILIGCAVLVVFAAVGFGAWFLIGGDDEKAGGLTYSALKKPCEELDTSPMDPVLDGAGTRTDTNEVEEHAHSTEQDCRLTYGDAGKSGSIAVYSQVFGRDAGAKNAYEDALDDAKANAKEAKDSGGGTQKVGTADNVGSKAYTITRKPSEDSKTIDYTLAYYEDNAFIETRISVFNNAASKKEIAGYTEEVAQKYMQNWAAAG